MKYRYDSGKVSVIDGEGNTIVTRTATKAEAAKLIKAAVTKGEEIEPDKKARK